MTKVVEKTVLLMCGLPGAGKSSLARRAFQHEASTAIIEYDHLQENLVIDSCDNNDDSKEQQSLLVAWKKSRLQALKTLNEKLQDTVTSVVVMDDNFYLRSMRKQVYQVCQQQRSLGTACRIHFGIIWMDTPVQVCLEWNGLRETTRRVPESIISRMKDRFEPPLASKATWEKAILVLNGASTNIESLVEEMRSFQERLSHMGEALVQPPVNEEEELQRLQEERRKTNESRLHQADRLLRQCVQTTGKLRPTAGKQANQVRRKVFQDLKQDRANDSFQDIDVVGWFLEGLKDQRNSSWTAKDIADLDDEINKAL